MLKRNVFILLCVIGKCTFSQTEIFLTHKDGPKQDHYFVNPGDSAFVSLWRDTDMGEWTRSEFTLKTTIPDGMYIVYVNQITALKAFIKDFEPDSTWTFYDQGNLYRTVNYKHGKLHGEERYYYPSGKPWVINQFKDGNFEGGIAYYESGALQETYTKKGNKMVVEKYNDSLQVKPRIQTDSLNKK